MVKTGRQVRWRKKGGLKITVLDLFPHQLIIIWCLKNVDLTQNSEQNYKHETKAFMYSL